MKSLSKMNMNELRQLAVELGVDQSRTYGVSKQGLVVMINAQKDINTAIESGMIEAETTAENEKEENTMTQSTFTTKLGNTFSTNESGTYFYMTDAEGKKTRIKKRDYEQAQREHELEQMMDRDIEMMNEMDEEIAKLDEAAEDENVTLQEFCEMLSEDEKATIEPAEAELLNNTRKEKKTKKTARKPRKSKDIAYGGHGVTLTAKQVDFIHHLPDTCFWENGLDSTPWTDILADEIGGQFEGKPMTTGAMISTICEKGLATRAKGKVNGKKATYMALTELGKEIAKELGLE